jgi:hypothetical protein
LPNWPPYWWIENDRLQGNPTEHLGIVGKNINSTPGAAVPGWTFEPILPTITDKVCQYIRQRAKEDSRSSCTSR